MARYWPRFISACRKRYGSVFTMRIATMGTLVYLDDPAEIKKVFAGSPSVYHAGEANMMLGGLLGNSSVLVIDDDVHRERRRQMLPAFHRDAVARQTALMAEIAAANIAKWPVGKEFAVAQQDVGDHPRGDSANRHRRIRPIPPCGVTRGDAEVAQRDSVGLAGDRQTDPAAAGPVAHTSSQHGRGGPAAVRRNRRPASRSRTWLAHRRVGEACPCGRRRRRHDDRQGTARPADHPARRRARHDGDRAVVGARTADTPSRPPAQSGATPRRQARQAIPQATSSSMRWRGRRCGSALSSSTSAAS